MKKIVMILSLACLLACENKRDTNGDLGGMWQMTSWVNADGDTVASKGEYYYYFQLNLMKLHRLGVGYHLARFAHEGQTLTVTAAYAEPHDSLVPVSQLAGYGVPADGVFNVDLLNDDALILSSDEGRLVFRKY